MSKTLLHRDDRGEVRADGNELFVEDRVATGDPVAICLHSINETIGKLSIRMRVGGSWKEVGFIGFKRDERGRTDPAHRDALEVEFWTHIPGRGFEDPDYRRMFAIRHDGITSTQASPRVTRFYSDDGRYCFNVQGDAGGHLVQYDTRGTTDETQWVAVAEWKGART